MCRKFFVQMSVILSPTIQNTRSLNIIILYLQLLISFRIHSKTILYWKEFANIQHFDCDTAAFSSGIIAVSFDNTFDMKFYAFIVMKAIRGTYVFFMVFRKTLRKINQAMLQFFCINQPVIQVILESWLERISVKHEKETNNCCLIKNEYPNSINLVMIILSTW